MAAIMFDQKIAKNSNMYFDSVMTSAAVENSCAVSPTAAEIVQIEVNVIGNVNDKDGDMIPDRLDSTFDPKTAENNESHDVKEQDHTSDMQEEQSKNLQAQEIRTETDDSFDEMLEKNKDQIPPLYDDYMPEPPSDYIMSEPQRSETSTNNMLIKHVTQEELDILRASGLNPEVNRKAITEDGKIPIRFNAQDKGKFEKIISDLKKSNENKVVNKK